MTDILKKYYNNFTISCFYNYVVIEYTNDTIIIFHKSMEENNYCDIFIYNHPLNDTGISLTGVDEI
jgi:hypothetical protein